MIKRFFILMTTTGFLNAGASAQTVTKGFEMGELVRIGYAYREVPYLSFNIKYQYADSSSPATILEEINGQYKIHEGRYWALLDSTEMVQGNNYNLTIFHEDKMMSVHKPQYADNSILQLPVLDTVISNYTDSLTVSQVNDSTRLLKVFFKTGMPCNGYEMKYNQNNYLVSSIQYYLKDANDSTGSGTHLIKVTISSYSQDVISEDVFMESKFIYRDGTFYTRPQYSDYEIVVDGDF